MSQNNQLSFEFKAIFGKRVTADFTGGDVSGDVGVILMIETVSKNWNHRTAY